MSIHDSSVNYENLIRDLADMYPFEVAEVVIVELVANSLDAKATNISIDYNHHNRILVVTDDGKGMNAAQFDEYHDFAAGLKTRGSGIGFAGVGAKISFNIADRVETETRSDSFSGASVWYLKSRKKLVWEDSQPLNLQNNGTRVEIHLSPDSAPPYSDTGDLIELLKRHYLPLFDKTFLEIYNRMQYYSSNLRFKVNGQSVLPCAVIEDLDLESVRKFVPKKIRKRIGYGVFGLSKRDYPLGPGICGVLLCTHGKVIKAELFNQFPGNIGPRLFGVVEVPSFVSFLTTSKTDFINTRGRKNKEFEDLYDPIRQEFKSWLAEIGIQTSDFIHTDEARKLESELKKIVEEIPELGEFFGFWTRKTILEQSESGIIKSKMQEGIEKTFPDGKGINLGESAPNDVGNEPGYALMEDQENGAERAKPISRTARRGPKISFLSVPDRVDLAWVEGNNVVINSGHPSYAKTLYNPVAKRVHCFFAIGAAIQRFVASSDNTEELNLIDRLMAAWGKK